MPDDAGADDASDNDEAITMTMMLNRTTEKLNRTTPKSKKDQERTKQDHRKN